MSQYADNLERCPKCKIELHDDWNLYSTLPTYICGSNESFQSNMCRIRELTAELRRLEGENERLRAAALTPDEVMSVCLALRGFLGERATYMECDRAAAEALLARLSTASP